MNKEKDRIKQQLEQDVNSTYFTKDMQASVLANAAKNKSFWNREITLRLPKSAAAFILIIMVGAAVMFSVGSLNTIEQTKEQLIKLNTGIYSKSELQQLIKRG